MKKIFIFWILTITSISAISQNFQLNFSNIEKFLLENYSPSIIEKAIKPNYVNVSKSDKEWKFRDDNKSWEAILYIQFDPQTLYVKEIAFVAPDSRGLEYLRELEDKLGYKIVSTLEMDILENKTKNLGAKLVSAEFMGKDMYYYRLYRLNN